MALRSPADPLWQNRLSKARYGWSPKDFGATGFDDDLLDAIRAFQAAHFLDETGVVDRPTALALKPTVAEDLELLLKDSARFEAHAKVAGRPPDNDPAAAAIAERWAGLHGLSDSRGELPPSCRPFTFPTVLYRLPRLPSPHHRAWLQAATAKAERILVQIPAWTVRGLGKETGRTLEALVNATEKPISLLFANDWDSRLWSRLRPLTLLRRRLDLVFVRLTEAGIRPLPWRAEARIQSWATLLALPTWRVVPLLTGSPAFVEATWGAYTAWLAGRQSTMGGAWLLPGALLPPKPPPPLEKRGSPLGAPGKSGPKGPHGAATRLRRSRRVALRRGRVVLRAETETSSPISLDPESD